MPEAVFGQLLGQKNFLSLKKSTVFDQFNKVTCGKLSEGVNIDQLEEWQFIFAKYTNIYIINGLQKIVRLPAPDRLNASSSIVLMLTNGHCTGIDNDRIKKDVIKKDRIDLFKIEFDLTATNYEVYKPEILDDLIKGKVMNNVILDEDHDIVLLMNSIIKESGYVIEQFNFRSQSNVSAFVHPISGKMIIE